MADKVQNEIMFSASSLASTLNVTVRRVQQLAEEGVVIKDARGKYRAIESIQRYIRYLQEREGLNQEGIDFNREKALHEKTKRELAELDLAVRKGELHRGEDVRMVMTDMLTAFRAKILAIPTKLAPQLVGKADLAQITSIITAELHEALKELSDYDPQVFNAKNDDYVGLSDDEEAE
jgi:phage terminase Nu1 subunit (DNA packaging protein)